MNTGKQAIIIGLRRDAHYWEAQHDRAVEREKMWKERIHKLEEMVSDQRERITEQAEEIASLKARITEQNKQIEALKAKVSFLQQQVFGKKSEKAKKSYPEAQPKEPGVSNTTVVKRERGKQKGAKGYGRKRHEWLETEENIHNLPEANQRCPICGKSFKILKSLRN
jgi:DNA repair exonuclease SbcCD ATPase subunit